MKTISNVILMGIVAASVAACSASNPASEETIDTTAAKLTGPNGQGFFGSDTLHEAITTAIAASPAAGSLTYYGSGSGNGEKCLRGAAVNYSGATYCSGSKDQSIAPMSRNLNGCQAGEVSHRVALDGIGLWSAPSQSISDLSLADVRGAFCGTDGSGSAAACSLSTWGTLSNGASASNPDNAINLYRRDDVSGTTDTFKSILASAGQSCTAFCGSVKVVVDRVGGPFLSTDGETSSLQAPNGPCVSTDSATDCIGRLTAASSDVLAYAGLGATAKASPKALSVAGKTPTLGAIRALVSDPANAYAFARFLYLNENTTTTRALAEEKFLKWAFGQAPYGTEATSLAFENKFEGAGFIACTDPADPDHLPLDCGSSACP